MQPNMPGSIYLSPADATNAFYCHMRAYRHHYQDVTASGEIRPRPLRPAIWRTTRGYTFNVSKQAYEANEQTGWELVQRIEWEREQ